MRQETQLVEEAAAAADASQAHLGAHRHSARLPRDPQRTQPPPRSAGGQAATVPGPFVCQGRGAEGGQAV